LCWVAALVGGDGVGSMSCGRGCACRVPLASGSLRTRRQTEPVSGAACGVRYPARIAVPPGAAGSADHRIRNGPIQVHAERRLDRTVPGPRERSELHMAAPAAHAVTARASSDERNMRERRRAARGEGRPSHLVSIPSVQLHRRAPALFRFREAAVNGKTLSTSDFGRKRKHTHFIHRSG
jgi:hypothetical protein